MATHEIDIEKCELLAGPPYVLIQSFSLADEQDLQAISVLCAQYDSFKAGKSSSLKMLTKEKKAIFNEDKENFLMPAPKVPLRSEVRKRKTKDVNEEIILPRNSRVTRSSRLNSVLPEDVCMADKPVRTRSTRSTQVLSTNRGLNETSVICESDSSMTSESKKSRRGTKKVKNTPPRQSRRGTRASSRIGAFRASTRASSRAHSRKSSHVLTKCNSPFLEVKESVRPSRATRTGKNSVNVAQKQLLKSPLDPKLSKNFRPKSLFSPYQQNSVKKRVEAFEELSSKEVKKMEAKLSENVPNGMVIDGSQDNEEAVRASPVNVEDIVQIRIDSPLVKGKEKLGYKKLEVSFVEEVFIKEEVDEDASAMEVEENDGMFEELLKTSNTDDGTGFDEQSRGCGNDCTYNLIADDEKKDDENAADDEWMTDDEDKASGINKKGMSDNYCTPKQKASSTSKLAQEVLGSYKALRNRKVNKGTSEVSLALSGKEKKTPVMSKAAPNLATPSTKAEFEIKEAELMRQQEKEKKAMKRKEELLKKRTETTKKKREEKMSKVKRTREEREKELEAKKAKKANQPAKKKKMKEAELEVVDKKTPEQVASPVPRKVLNSTYTKPEEDQYALTPPKQPKDLNDYGVVDNSDCSSEEENDPRKKIPLWTKEIRPDLVCQSLIPVSVIHEFWQTKPRALNIKDLFGNKVSKNTLKRGLHIRTSSAIWHTPPVKI